MNASRIKIKINIAGRLYPMLVAPHEEEAIRKAGKIITEKINLFEEQYDVQDKQDVLAMIALMLAFEKEINQNHTVSENQNTHQKLEYLIHLIDQHLT